MKVSECSATKLLKERKRVATTLSIAIESTLESFGIKGKIMAANFEADHVLLQLSIAPGIRIEEVESLSRTIALVVASPTGTVKIIAPIPNTSYLGIKIPTGRKGKA